MPICDASGLGKTTVLTHLSKQIKRYLTAKWVVRIDLNAHADRLKTLSTKQFDNNANEFEL